jgi:uncharacterized membrane protein
VVRLLNAWDTLRGSFWFLPAVFTLLAVGLAVGLLAIDRTLGSEVITGSAWLYSGGAEGARSLLSALAGSIITVVGLAFSITIVSLQLASAQLGPRLLRNFVRDPGNQIVLGVFVATFVYCLVVLRTVRGQDGVAAGTFVPHTAVTGAVALALVSVVLLIYFIHHASTSIQADHVVAAVARDLDAGIDRLFPERLGHEEPTAAAPALLTEDGVPVLARRTGYVVSMDGDTLLRVAGEIGAVVRLLHRPGDFVVAGELLARIHPVAGVNEQVERTVAGAVTVGDERTFVQDVLFGVEQLVEIAVRTLASGYIDPSTALRCVDRLGAALAAVSGRRLPSPERRAAGGAVRVVVPPLTLADFVTAAFTPIRLQGAGNRAVAVRLLDTFARVAVLHERRDLHQALLDEATRIRRAAGHAFRDPADREAVYEAFERVVRAMAPVLRRHGETSAAAA